MLKKLNYRKALVTSLIVGTVLTIINQGHVIWEDADFRVVPCVLTYLVPFCVFLYGQWSNQ